MPSRVTDANDRNASRQSLGTVTPALREQMPMLDIVRNMPIAVAFDMSGAEHVDNHKARLAAVR